MRLVQALSLKRTFVLPLPRLIDLCSQGVTAALALTTASVIHYGLNYGHAKPLSSHSEAPIIDELEKTPLQAHKTAPRIVSNEALDLQNPLPSISPISVDSSQEFITTPKIFNRYEPPSFSTPPALPPQAPPSHPISSLHTQEEAPMIALSITIPMSEDIEEDDSALQYHSTFTRIPLALSQILNNEVHAPSSTHPSLPFEEASRPAFTNNNNDISNNFEKGQAILEEWRALSTTYRLRFIDQMLNGFLTKSETRGFAVAMIKLLPAFAKDIKRWGWEDDRAQQETFLNRYLSSIDWSATEFTYGLIPIGPLRDNHLAYEAARSIAIRSGLIQDDIEDNIDRSH